MPAPDFSLSQSITKFLRTTRSCSDVVLTSLTILEDPSSVLPKKEAFIAQLLEERLNDELNNSTSKNASKKKQSVSAPFHKYPETWDLLLKILACSEPETIKIVKGIRFLQLLNLVLKTGDPIILSSFVKCLGVALENNHVVLKNENVLSIFLSCVNQLITNFTPIIHYDAFEILFKYLVLTEAINLSFATKSGFPAKNHPIREAVKFHNSSSQFLIANFIENDLLRNLLREIDGHPLFGQLVDMFVANSVVTDVTDSQILNFSYLQTHLDKFVAKGYPESITHLLYRFVLRLCHNIYVKHKLTKNRDLLREFNHHVLETVRVSSTLLEINLEEAHTLNQVYLGPEFVSKLYLAELAKCFGSIESDFSEEYCEKLSKKTSKEKFESLDFATLNSIILIEAKYCRDFKNCASKFGPFILLAVVLHPSEESSTVLGSLVDFFSFTSHTFLRFLEYYRIVNILPEDFSVDYEKIIIPSIKTLSTTQFENALRSSHLQIIQKDVTSSVKKSHYSIFNIFLRYLSSLGVSNNAFANNKVLIKTLLGFFDEFLTKNDRIIQYFEMIYHFLNVFQIDDLAESQIKTIEKLFVDEIGDFIPQYLIALRYLEVFPDAKKIQKVLKKALAGPQILFSIIGKRFFNLIALVEETKLLKKYIRSLFGLPHSDLKAIFSNVMFFENQKLNGLICSALVSHFETGENLEFFLELTRMIPIEALEKSSRAKIIDILASKPREFSLKTIFHLLQYPTHLSQVETELMALKDLITKEFLSDVKAIIKQIVSDHLKQHEEKVSQNYLESILNVMNSQLEPYQRFLVCDVVCHNIDGYYTFTERFSALRSEFNAVCVEYLQQLKPGFDATEVAIVLGTVFKSGNTVSGEFGKLASLVSSEDTLKMMLFCVLPKFSTVDFKFCVYYIDLYRVLHANIPNRSPLSDLSLETGILKLVSGLSEKDLIMLYSYVLKTFGQAKAASADLVGVFIHGLSEKKQEYIGYNRKQLWLDTINVIEENLIPEIFDSILHTFEYVLCEANFLVSQSSFERVLVVLCRLAEKGNNEERYVFLTTVLSRIFLLYRFRLRGRYHVVVRIMNALMELLTEGVKSLAMAENYCRLLGNLVSPNDQSAASLHKSSEGEMLSSNIDAIKRDLRKHAGNIVLEYVRLALEKGFDAKMDETLRRQGIFQVFDLLTQSDLSGVNALLDVSSRAFFKTIYTEWGGKK